MHHDSLAVALATAPTDTTATPFNFWHQWTSTATEVLHGYTGPTDGELLSGALILIVVVGLLVVGTIATIKWIAD